MTTMRAATVSSRSTTAWLQCTSWTSGTRRRRSTTRRAYGELPWTQKYIGSKQLKNVIRLGIANSMYGQYHRQSAQELFEKLLKDADTESEKQLLRSQYVPNMRNTKKSDG